MLHVFNRYLSPDWFVYIYFQFQEPINWSEQPPWISRCAVFKDRYIFRTLLLPVKAIGWVPQSALNKWAKNWYNALWTFHAHFLLKQSHNDQWQKAVIQMEWSQCAKKVVSDSPGLVDFAIRLMNSVLNLPDEKVMFFEEFKLQKNCVNNLACLLKSFWG